MNLQQRIARLEQQQGDVGRRATFLFVNIPGGKPSQLCYDDGTEENWAGEKDYPAGVTVLRGIDPDIALGRVLLDGARQAAPDER
jgi:hypothetical protein